MVDRVVVTRESSRPTASCRAVGGGPACRPGDTDWYFWAMHPGPSCSPPSLGVRLPKRVRWPTTLQSWIGAFPMIKHYTERAWKLAVTVGPLVAVALALAAGTKWH